MGAKAFPGCGTRKTRAGHRAFCETTGTARSQSWQFAREFSFLFWSRGSQKKRLRGRVSELACEGISLIGFNVFFHPFSLKYLYSILINSPFLSRRVPNLHYHRQLSYNNLWYLIPALMVYPIFRIVNLTVVGPIRTEVRGFAIGLYIIGSRLFCKTGCSARLQS